MSTRIEPCVNIDFDEKTLEDVVSKAKDWAVMHGAGMRSKTAYNPDSLNVAPFVLLPTPYPRREFEKALKLQPLINELVYSIANNHEFLEEVLAVTITVDPFTAELYRIYKQVREEGVGQDECCCCLVRCDYMLDRDTIRQVEINTIASSFAGIAGSRIPRLHRYVLQELSHGDKIDQLPENLALEGICGGMLKAWEIYGQPKAAILFIVEDVTYNICDQRFHEFQIRKMNPNVNVLRFSLTTLGQGAARLGPNKELIVNGQEVAVVYFRCGYAPDQYSSPDGCEWAARLLIERSKAIKSPSINYHLAGTKKVQQVLAQPGVLERLLGDKAKAEALRDSFTGLYSLDMNEEGDRAVEMAMKDPNRFVLKPQREGGGNNIYGEEVKEALERMKGTSERAGYILMDIIQPPLIRNWVIRPGVKPFMDDTVSELGIFGVVIGNGKEVFHNSVSGHMLRTKLQSSTEGGVVGGSGSLDSPFLVDF